MKQIIFSILILLLFQSCSGDYRGSPDELLNMNFNSNKKKFIMVNPSQMEECDIVTFKENKFSICYKTGTENEKSISYIFTRDKKYITANKIRVGSSYLELKMKFSNAEVIDINGWAKVVKLPSKWIAGFDYEGEVKDDSKILFIYYYNDIK